MNILELIREEMRKRNVDLWIGCSFDEHGSEYICDHDNVIRFVSGFTGENGVLAVFADECADDRDNAGAYLWVDGRFFLQAPREIEGRGITLMKSGQKNVPKFSEWLTAQKQKGLTVSEDRELIASVWKDRPPRPCNRIWIHDSAYEDRTPAGKLAELRQRMRQLRELRNKAFPEKKDMPYGLWVKGLDETAWLTNLRGSDIEYNPVFFSYMYVDEKKAVLYVQEGAADEAVIKHLKANGIEPGMYENAEKPAEAEELHLVSEMKAQKSPAEASHMEACCLRDAAAVTRFIYRIKKTASDNGDGKLTEMGAGSMLDEMRSADENFIGLSFPTICAYGGNGAIIHYTANEETDTAIRNSSFLLVDSGAHYLDGTTDVTRTIAMGPLSYEEKRDYTLVMIGMLRLMNAAFSEDTDSVILNNIARKPLIDMGLDFDHGVGHGIGYVNVVHEGPVSIRRKGEGFTFKPGMVVSDEPGVYIQGSHGVRIENMLLCTEDTENREHAGPIRLHWSNLTWVPLEREAVLPELMTEEDIKYYNEYQFTVYEKLSPVLDKEEREWLRKECSTI